jgi:hypothetical protein
MPCPKQFRRLSSWELKRLHTQHRSQAECSTDPNLRVGRPALHHPATAASADHQQSCRPVNVPTTRPVSFRSKPPPPCAPLPALCPRCLYRTCLTPVLTKRVSLHTRYVHKALRALASVGSSISASPVAFKSRLLCCVIAQEHVSCVPDQAEISHVTLHSTSTP